MTNSNLLTPAPLDDTWGFIGTILRIGDIDKEAAARLWKVATNKLAGTYQETRPDVIRNFLRSRHGRHFADDASNMGLKWNQKTDCEKALAEGIEKSLSDPDRWSKFFNEVKEATISGKWED
ncbi:MAG: hypothetical protein K9L30_17700 [Desulfobacterales bacterium]|nr:hypothetical protein [Desulfobacterales bacterium]